MLTTRWSIRQSLWNRQMGDRFSHRVVVCRSKRRPFTHRSASGPPPPPPLPTTSHRDLPGPVHAPTPGIPRRAQAFSEPPPPTVYRGWSVESPSTQPVSEKKKKKEATKPPSEPPGRSGGGVAPTVARWVGLCRVSHPPRPPGRKRGSVHSSFPTRHDLPPGGATPSPCPPSQRPRCPHTHPPSAAVTIPTPTAAPTDGTTCDCRLLPHGVRSPSTATPPPPCHSLSTSCLARPTYTILWCVPLCVWGVWAGAWGAVHRGEAWGVLANDDRRGLVAVPPPPPTPRRRHPSASLARARGRVRAPLGAERECAQRGS